MNKNPLPFLPSPGETVLCYWSVDGECDISPCGKACNGRRVVLAVDDDDWCTLKACAARSLPAEELRKA